MVTKGVKRGAIAKGTCCRNAASQVLTEAETEGGEGNTEGAGGMAAHVGTSGNPALVPGLLLGLDLPEREKHPSSLPRDLAEHAHPY